MWRNISCKLSAIDYSITFILFPSSFFPFRFKQYLLHKWSYLGNSSENIYSTLKLPQKCRSQAVWSDVVLIAHLVIQRLLCPTTHKHTMKKVGVTLASCHLLQFIYFLQINFKNLNSILHHVISNQGTICLNVFCRGDLVQLVICNQIRLVLYLRTRILQGTNMMECSLHNMLT